jgi:hypothetical protein
MFTKVEPPHTYVRDLSASVVHHGDYLNRRDDHALCGITLTDPTTLTLIGQADALCPDCEAKLVLYHLEWWREKAQAATAELDALRAKYGITETSTSPEPPEPPPLPFSAETDVTFLDRARRELADLCQQFDGALPYFRLKNAMQAFSDRLDTRERVVLAQEIGADGSLIRWATVEVEGLGWQVTNSPVHEESASTWETWHQDAYQPPEKTKRRFGRARSHEGR